MNQYERGRKRLANEPTVERIYTPSREAVKAALRVVLGWPKAPVRKEMLDGGAEDQGG